MDKKILIRNFSKYARSYDKYADIQKCAASELLWLMKEDGFIRILEIGCGTGNYTLLLRERFKDASLKAIDISGKMIDVASEKLKDKSVEFIVADAETVNIRGDFDCITSNASFQWFSDLGKMIKKYSAAIKKGGLILFSIFGPATFRELNASMGLVLKDISTAADNFVSKETTETLLKENFNRVWVKEVLYKESFLCLNDLLHKIKFSGIRGNGINGRTTFTPHILRDIEKAYLDKFGQISATYQIFYCEGRR